VNLAAWQALVNRLGWQVYVSTKAHYDAPALVAAYHQQVVQERGFSRLKTRHLHIRPVYLRDEKRIAGLLWLLCLALRVLTLTEYRLRTALVERGEAVIGLNPASRTQSTVRPTTEWVLDAFTSITLTSIEMGGRRSYHVTPLNATQRHVLAMRYASMIISIRQKEGVLYESRYTINRLSACVQCNNSLKRARCNISSKTMATM